jgi:hypothetical protein
MSDDRHGDLDDIAYESLFSLVAHYSSQIFRARELIILFVLVVWALVLGIQAPIGDEPPASVLAMLRPVSAVLGALAIGFFVLMKTIYIRMYWRVVEAGKALENDRTRYFARVTKPLTWPFQVFYWYNVALLLFVWMTSDVASLLIRSLVALPSVACLAGVLVYNLRIRSGKAA